MSQKRAAEDDVISEQRYTRIRLASPSPTKSSGSDTESILSCQGYETEFVKDTSDTSSSPTSYNIEYEITDVEEKKERFYISEDTEDSESAVVAELNNDIGALTCDSLDLALLGDTSEENSTSPTSNSDVDPGLPRNDYLDFEKCLLCQTDKKDISYPYCNKCFSWKKNLFPDRPKKRNKAAKQENISNFESNISNAPLSTSSSSLNDKINSKVNSDRIDNLGCQSHLSEIDCKDSAIGSSEPQLSEDVVDGPIRPSTSTPTTSSPRKLTLDVCRVCFLKPENGLFVHLNIAHLYGCYTCAKKIWFHNGGCPICRRKIFKVAKLFV